MIALFAQIRFCHQSLGLSRPPPVLSTLQPGLYEVVYEGGVRLRETTSMQPVLEEVVKHTSVHELVQIVVGEDGVSACFVG